MSQIIGKPNTQDVIEFWCDAWPVFSERRGSFRECGAKRRGVSRGCAITLSAPIKNARATAVNDSGLSMTLSFDPSDDIAAPFIARGHRPRVAILREQGVNSQTEMAYAFDRAGFAAVDVHMTDLIQGRQSLSDFNGLIACGGLVR